MKVWMCINAAAGIPVGHKVYPTLLYDGYVYDVCIPYTRDEIENSGNFVEYKEDEK